jgi:type I restriction enzyme R subunit
MNQKPFSSSIPTSLLSYVTIMPFTACWLKAYLSTIIPRRSPGQWLCTDDNFEDSDNNDWLVVNQFTVEASYHNHRVNRRPDVVVFINGLPLAVIELKNAADPNATIWSAFNQLQTYKEQIPALFVTNENMIISDGLTAHIGSLTPVKVVPALEDHRSGSVAPPPSLSSKCLLKGVFEKRRFLDMLRYFIVFETDRGAPTLKKIAGYHQFHAVNVAVEETLRAAREQRAVGELKGQYHAARMQDGKPGDRRIGVVWHTQGAGKSLTMVFYTGRIVLHPAMENPTIVVITDRNDLDGQLFGTFSRCAEILRQLRAG